MNAKETLELLKSRINIGYFLKPDEVKLIEAACINYNVKAPAFKPVAKAPAKKVVKSNGK